MSLIDKDFLLKTATSKRIYQQFSANLPIVDYHCHLKSDEIYKNKKFRNITELWLEKDHYKWRLMRANGVEENKITGDAPDKEKFFAWAQTIERCVGNPLYHWTHMELRQFFDVSIPLNRQTAETIWHQVNQQLGENGLGAQDFIRQANVWVIGTTDPPLSQLVDHQKIAQAKLAFQVVPTFRMDKVLQVEDITWFAEISQLYHVTIDSIHDYLRFIQERINYFVQHGCRSADLGIGKLEWKRLETNPEETFVKLRADGPVSATELLDVKTYLLQEILEMFYEKKWVFQLHFGAVGSVNRVAKARLGTGTGFDTITEQENIAEPFIYLFNELHMQGKLPKTILYNIDGTKNRVVQSIMACFQENEQKIRGKMQHGPAWWFQDTLSGNQQQIKDLAEQGILMNFVGMTTDSRSFLSYVRHDYFRRILCDCLGHWIEAGEMPEEDMFIRQLIEAVSYKNALTYFNFEGSESF